MHRLVGGEAHGKVVEVLGASELVGAEVRRLRRWGLGSEVSCCVPVTSICGDAHVGLYSLSITNIPCSTNYAAILPKA